MTVMTTGDVNNAFDGSPFYGNSHNDYNVLDNSLTSVAASGDAVPTLSEFETQFAGHPPCVFIPGLADPGWHSLANAGNDCFNAPMPSSLTSVESKTSPSRVAILSRRERCSSVKLRPPTTSKLVLDYTGVTDDGVGALKQTLPELAIVRHDRQMPYRRR